MLSLYCNLVCADEARYQDQQEEEQQQQQEDTAVQMEAAAEQLAAAKRAREAERRMEAITEVEMVLQTYFHNLDNTSNKLQTINEFMDDVEVGLSNCSTGGTFASEQKAADACPQKIGHSSASVLGPFSSCLC
jgi:rubrerythrin